MEKAVDRQEHPVAWCASIVPVEFLRTMDVMPLLLLKHYG